MCLDLREVYLWDVLIIDIAMFLARRINCQKIKGEHLKPSVLTKEMGIPTWKYEEMNMDLFVGLPRTWWNNDSIWVNMDTLKKYNQFIPV